MLNIITVWHNEEKNLNKYFNSLNHFKDLIKIKIIYCDQWSTDKSLEIATLYHAQIYQHGKKWYCERSRKWCVDNLFQNWEWILVLDCDEEITKDLAKEIYHTIAHTSIGIIKIPKNTIAFWMPVGIEHAIRLFRKWVIEVTDTIHEYIKITDEPYIILKNNLENNDLKEELWKEVFNRIQKINTYTQIHFLKEISKKGAQSNLALCYHMLKDMIMRFLYFYIRIRLIKYWLKWFLYCLLQSYYPVVLYFKVLLWNNKNDNN